MLAWALAGVWLSWPWFVFNAYALGLDRKRPLFRALAIGLLGSSALAWLIVALHPEAFFDIFLLWEWSALSEAPSSLPYLLIVLSGWKFAVSLILADQQDRAVEVFTYFGGVTRKGSIILAAGYFLRGWVLLELLPVGWWTLVLS